MLDDAAGAIVWIFQSTLPTRGSDGRARMGVAAAKKISIHAPHEGERPSIRSGFCPDRNFNPRSPRGGATAKEAEKPVSLAISIHAPHEGERRYSMRICAYVQEISIHAPHEGERRGAEKK